MVDLKITTTQMKNYLDTGLYCLLDYGNESYLDELIGIHTDGDLLFSEDQGDTHTVDTVKPECYRMSDLDKFIPALGFVPAKELAKLITQSGWNSDKIQSIRNEDDTITCVWPITTLRHPASKTSISYQNFFEIDTDSDFGFGIYYQNTTSNGVVEEIESNTGNIWAMTQKLFEWHFWPFEEQYFTVGLVLDKLRREAVNG
jgi:hypothetical protein